MEFTIYPNYIDTLLIEETRKNKVVLSKCHNVKHEFVDGECSIEFEFYDGIAYATDGSGIVLKYPKMEIVKNSKRRQDSITDYNGINDEINQYDIALKYGVLDYENNTNDHYVKRHKTNSDWLAETYILLSADIYSKVYNMVDVGDYNQAAEIVRDAAERFERELDWQGDSEDRDFILELEKFEEEELKRLRVRYDCY